jgi:Holliday junction DNA helicase RuvA
VYDHIQGEVVAVQPAQVVLRAAGVGYQLQVPTSVSAALTQGTTACLYTILHVTDGQPRLIGFHDRREREFARLMMSVAGVGPSMSLTILSTYTVAQVGHAIVIGDHEVLQRVKGVGKKTAERLCLELRDKVGKLQLEGIELTPSAVLVPQSCEDAIAALMTLGFAEKDAQKRVGGLHETRPEATTEELIKLVLRG